jgi:hypothetical protein
VLFVFFVVNNDHLAMPEPEIAISRPQRWDEPFGQMTDREVDHLLRIAPFREIDASAFPLRQQCISDFGWHGARGARATRS